MLPARCSRFRRRQERTSDRETSKQSLHYDRSVLRFASPARLPPLESCGPLKTRATWALRGQAAIAPIRPGPVYGHAFPRGNHENIDRDMKRGHV